MKRRFKRVDVFGARPFLGNPVPISATSTSSPASRCSADAMGTSRRCGCARSRRQHFLKEVSPAFRASSPEPSPPAAGEAPATLLLESLAAEQGRIAAQSNGNYSAVVSVRRGPTTGGQVREEKLEDSKGTHLPGVTPAPDPAD